MEAEMPRYWAQTEGVYWNYWCFAQTSKSWNNSLYRLHFSVVFQFDMCFAHFRSFCKSLHYVYQAENVESIPEHPQKFDSRWRPHLIYSGEERCELGVWLFVDCCGCLCYEQAQDAPWAWTSVHYAMQQWFDQLFC